MEKEFLDVVDLHNQVTGRAAVSEIYAKKLPHRIVHILIYNNAGEMCLQLRSATKSFCPLHWSTAVGGHVQSGESYEQAALREFQEELGTTVPVQFLLSDLYSDSRGNNKFLQVFKATYDGPFTINKEEVERVEWFALDKIKQMIANGEKFHPELAFILKRL